MSSSTDPFVPQEHRFRITQKILEAMLEKPPGELIIQTHSHSVLSYLDLYPDLSKFCSLRFHISIESDRDRLPGLPPPASSVEQRFEAARKLRDAGLTVVITVAPLLPIENPRAFFERIADSADAVVIDHFIQGDGSTEGSRTSKTDLPAAMARVDQDSLLLDYRDRIVAIAQEILPGRVGVNVDGFAGRFLSA